MLERQIDIKFQEHVQDNILHFIEDFNRISCKDEAYLLNCVPSRLLNYQLPTSWQLLTNFLRDDQLKVILQRKIQWLYFTPKTRIGKQPLKSLFSIHPAQSRLRALTTFHHLYLGNMGDVVDDYFIICKGTVIQIDSNNRSWKNGCGDIVGFLSLWTNERYHRARVPTDCILFLKAKWSLTSMHCKLAQLHRSESLIRKVC